MQSHATIAGVPAELENARRIAMIGRSDRPNFVKSGGETGQVHIRLVAGSWHPSSPRYEKSPVPAVTTRCRLSSRRRWKEVRSVF